MQVSSVGNVQVASAMSALQTANKQPQLAAELINSSSQPAARVQNAQQPAAPVNNTSDNDADDSGGRIDIRA